MGLVRLKKEQRPANTGFASGGITCKLGTLCFYETLVINLNFVLRNPPERKVFYVPKKYFSGDFSTVVQIVFLIASFVPE
jgi:hypothetical protein